LEQTKQKFSSLVYDFGNHKKQPGDENNSVLNEVESSLSKPIFQVIE
jgi:hypothetical protein